MQDPNVKLKLGLCNTLKDCFSLSSEALWKGLLKGLLFHKEASYFSHLKSKAQLFGCFATVVRFFPGFLIARRGFSSCAVHAQKSSTDESSKGGEASHLTLLLNIENHIVFAMQNASLSCCQHKPSKSVHQFFKKNT